MNNSEGPSAYVVQVLCVMEADDFALNWEIFDMAFWLHMILLQVMHFVENKDQDFVSEFLQRPESTQKQKSGMKMEFSQVWG